MVSRAFAYLKLLIWVSLKDYFTYFIEHELMVNNNNDDNDYDCCFVKVDL